jgi:ribose transport system substrate-binding protein
MKNSTDILRATLFFVKLLLRNNSNILGGQYATELLQQQLPGKSVVLVCGARNISSVADRMDGFSENIKSHQGEVIEFFAPVKSVEQAQMSILDAVNLFPEAQGVFLTNEITVLAYLELLRKGKLSQRQLCAVGFDMTSVIAQAIADGHLFGTIIQDPAQVGKVAAQELVTLFRQHQSTVSPSPKKVLIPVKTITRENLPSSV